MLQIAAQVGANVEGVVSSRLGDHKLWIDVLEQGAYDLLVERYELKRYGELSKQQQTKAICAPYLSPKR